MHKVQIYIRSLEHVQTLLQTLLSSGVECAPKLAGDEQILSLYNAPLDNILEGLADLIFVLVAESAVNVPVAALNGVYDRLLHFARGRLPRSQTKGWNRGASVEGNGSVHVGLWFENVFRGALKHEIRKTGIHGGSGYLKYM
jgi:hypothetical protein